ncbi:carboxylesterase (estA) [Archaeoglobus fulgidus DSM 4304]|jgi:acetyl esterase|uniref:Carboxylesterase (EstA) n=2 Tax=Archaeoglobus fulgidus TaxID=2234 RepID=O28558_ARCFU|nr:carboxylesterase (estA) [Archaeoglobus fulgidus DSM 4304]1JJI_A Chain A, Carboxylesterase [Archaeoglobus fulgidus]1JJI_B Chain B, Carboxylesterase [Archaeoglobus fulgidus]1JJI_C Chain C, Carboxylesterase [Archaeoglobus fulgidus]1JJI_D Chain D, Carboxylesterase [Archaeoglobus fulgidus]
MLDMPIDPVYYQLAEYFDSLPKFDQFSSAREYREAINRIYEERNRQLSQHERVERVEDRTIKGRNGDIRVRVYQQKPDSPVLVYYHGGGFVICSIESHDALCRRIARLSNSTVVSVDYRLAPEHKFPAAVYDCYDATKWVAENAEELRIDPSKIFVGGDSAGGNLAAAVSIMARDSGEDFIKHQILIYPVVNFVAPTPSLLEFGEGLWILDQKIMSWFSEQYFSREEDKFNPLASVIFADLENLPPALIITAEYDPLRDEGEVFGQMLRRAGVEASIVRYRGVLHGFINYYPVLKAARDAINQIAALLVFD